MPALLMLKFTIPSIAHSKSISLAIPSNLGQYILKPRERVGLFGVICEGLPRQVNFIIDEASSTGKGANTTISYVHYYFKKHGLGETDVHLNADNCAGQNKNNYFLWYLA